MFNHRKSKVKKKLFVGAMEKELEPIVEWLDAEKEQMILGKYPLYKGKNNSYILQTFVGSTNASIALLAAINLLPPDSVFKIGCTGSISQNIHKGEIVLPLGYFHSSAWITLKNNSKNTAKASKWTSLFGRGSCQVSKKNRGGVPYHFPAVSIPSCNTNGIKYKIAYIKSSDTWYFDKKTLINVKRTLAPKSTDNCILDMESYALAQTCFITNIPFIGIYVISDNSVFSDKKYNPDEIKTLIYKARPLLKTFSAI